MNVQIVSGFPCLHPVGASLRLFKISPDDFVSDRAETLDQRDGVGFGFGALESRLLGQKCGNGPVDDLQRGGAQVGMDAASVVAARPNARTGRRRRRSVDGRLQQQLGSPGAAREDHAQMRGRPWGQNGSCASCSRDRLIQRNLVAESGTRRLESRQRRDVLQRVVANERPGLKEPELTSCEAKLDIPRPLATPVSLGSRKAAPSPGRQFRRAGL
jgi:hypothetical protein